MALMSPWFLRLWSPRRSNTSLDLSFIPLNSIGCAVPAPSTLNRFNPPLPNEPSFHNHHDLYNLYQIVVIIKVWQETLQKRV